jgi:hypothetical protein
LISSIRGCQPIEDDDIVNIEEDGQGRVVEDARVF